MYLSHYYYENTMTGGNSYAWIIEPSHYDERRKKEITQMIYRDIHKITDKKMDTLYKKIIDSIENKEQWFDRMRIDDDIDLIIYNISSDHFRVEINVGGMHDPANYNLEIWPAESFTDEYSEM